MRRFWAILLFFCFATSAHAAPRVSIGQDFCTIGTESAAPIPSEAEWASNANCGDGRFADRSPRVWGRVDLSQYDFGLTPQALITDPTSHESFEIVARYADGVERAAHYGPEYATETWLPAMRFVTPIPRHDAKLESLSIAFERPESLVTFSSAEIAPAKDVQALQLDRTIIFAFLCGITLIPVIYNTVFFSILRERFMVWHSLMLLCVVTYIVSSSGLIFELWPETSLETRWHINIWAFALIVGLACLFAHDFIEQDKLSKWTRLLLRIGPVSLVFTTVLVLYGGEAFRITGRTLYFAAFLPWVLAFVFSIVQGLWRGSRAAWFLAASWATILFAGFERIARGMGLYSNDGSADFIMFYALAAETVLTSLGVADRFMTIRRERDLAAKRESRMRSMAHTDGLTELLNRRGFDRIFEDRKMREFYDHLAILDLDEFKEINDQYGHDIGDEVLRTVGKVLKSCKGAAGRIGGDEFVLLLTEDDEEQIIDYLDCLRQTVSDSIARDIPDIPKKVSMSAGVAPIIHGVPSGSVYALADERLYVAKERGRDTTITDARENRQSEAA